MTQPRRQPELAYEPNYYAGDALPPPGCPVPVAPGVHWLRMPMPMALDHINLWLLDDGDAWTVVDSGLNTDTTREAWEQVFARHLQGRPVRRVICTHMHPDHVGLADWLCRRWNAPLLMTQGEYLSARLISAGMAPTDTDGLIGHFRSHGASPEHLQGLAGRGNFYMRMVPSLPQTYLRLEDGQRLRMGGSEWQVLIGGGHSPEHASLWCAEHRVLISGDLLLPRISTNVSVHAIEPEADALGRYLRSLERFDALDAHTRVLPSHGLPFVGVHARVRQLREHHAERLDLVLQACAQRPLSAAELIPLLFRRTLDSHQLGFALGEAIAHAHRLWAIGALRRDIDSDGRIRFGAEAAQPARLEALARTAAGLSLPLATA